MPGEKRLYITNRTDEQLLQREWPKWTVERFNELLGSSKESGLTSFFQMQSIGGPKSVYHQNSLRKDVDGQALTAMSWRDTSVWTSMYCFYNVSANPNAQQNALNWTRQNEAEAYGPNGRFSDEPPEMARKMLLASYGDRNMGNVWKQ